MPFSLTWRFIAEVKHAWQSTFWFIWHWCYLLVLQWVETRILLHFSERANASREHCVSTGTIHVSGSLHPLKWLCLGSKLLCKQGQSRLLGTKHQENMGRGIAGGESVGINIVSMVVYPALLLYLSSFKLVNGKVTKYTRDNSYAPNLLEYTVTKSVPLGQHKIPISGTCFVVWLTDVSLWFHTLVKSIEDCNTSVVLQVLLQVSAVICYCLHVMTHEERKRWTKIATVLQLGNKGPFLPSFQETLP